MEDKTKTRRKTLTGLVLLTAMSLPLICNDGCANYHGPGIGNKERPNQENIRVVYENPMKDYKI